MASDTADYEMGRGHSVWVWSLGSLIILLKWAPFYYPPRKCVKFTGARPVLCQGNRSIHCTAFGLDGASASTTGDDHGSNDAKMDSKEKGFVQEGTFFILDWLLFVVILYYFWSNITKLSENIQAMLWCFLFIMMNLLGTLYYVLLDAQDQ